MSVEAKPTDPLAFDFGIGFKSAADRLDGEREDRKVMAGKLLPYHVPFLDDFTRGIMPHDLILLGADTGAGKTDMITHVARQNAMAGKRVFVFALEAEDREIERRTKYGLIAEWAFRRNVPIASRLNYVDWYLGNFSESLAELEREADEFIRTRLSGLRTYYRGRSFGHEEIHRLLTAIQDQADLIILDHLHYVDVEDENENAGYKRLVKMIRHTALEMGKPVILVVHLRKSQGMREPLAPSYERIHGSSDIAKVSTAVIMLSRAPFTGSEWWKMPTFVSVPKWRTGGACRHVALVNYDIRTRSYEREYTLGRLENNGTEWTEIEPDRVPPWAHKFIHRGGISTSPPTPIRRAR